jgi:hypothetical protein
MSRTSLAELHRRRAIYTAELEAGYVAKDGEAVGQCIRQLDVIEESIQRFPGMVRRWVDELVAGCGDHPASIRTGLACDQATRTRPT